MTAAGEWQHDEPGQERTEQADLPVAAAALPELAGEEILVPYRPYAGLARWLRYRFSAWSEVKAWFVMTLVVVFFGFGGPGFVLQSIISLLAGEVTAGAAAAAAATNQAVLWFLYMLFLFIATVVAYAYVRTPTHIRLGLSGIGFLYRTRLQNLLAGTVPWQRISHVYLFHPPGKTSPLDFRICFRRDDGDAFSVKMGHIATVEERARLLEAIKTYAPKVTRDPELLQALSPPQDHSYTELWLQALSAPPKRERLTPLSSGARLQNGRYIVLGQLGVGGQGTAYLARVREGEGNGNLSDGEIVVLKESILPVYVDVTVRKQALEQFQNEAQILRKLDHPQVVKLKEYFVEDHRSYLVLEHIEGRSLRDLVLADGPLPQDEVVALALQMCDILSYLHSLTPPVVHRDFTPDNIILNSDGLLKLVDFNVAHQYESTTTGTVVGKHAYIPPEQFRGKPTPQSDVYALGATVYYLLTGEDPEPISVSHPLLKREDVAPELDAIVARSTEIDGRGRYADPAKLRRDLMRLAGRA